MLVRGREAFWEAFPGVQEIRIYCAVSLSLLGGWQEGETPDELTGMSRAGMTGFAWEPLTFDPCLSQQQNRRGHS